MTGHGLKTDVVRRSTALCGAGHCKRLALFLLASSLQLAAVFPLGALEISCHIHPPLEKREGGTRATTLGPFDTEAVCESLRRRMFGDGGRCHCAPGFTSFPLKRYRRERGPGSGGPREEPPLP